MNIIIWYENKIHILSCQSVNSILRPRSRVYAWSCSDYYENEQATHTIVCFGALILDAIPVKRSSNILAATRAGHSRCGNAMPLFLLCNLFFKFLIFSVKDGTILQCEKIVNDADKMVTEILLWSYSNTPNKYYFLLLKNMTCEDYG